MCLKFGRKEGVGYLRIPRGCLLGQKTANGLSMAVMLPVIFCVTDIACQL